MFTHEELLTIKEAIKIADTEYMKQVEGATGNKNRVVANKKQKKLWLIQNKLNKLIEESK
ncbi:hypothetical protein [uncultured Clostridium sp.]|uniref:hypothetical protein n=1 Tax=uncultured Clostridium sp. TaxID=59620 RepID=UPI002612F9AA|nr:hypothetical protein [uncultured Clostridium sp.]